MESSEIDLSEFQENHDDGDGGSGQEEIHANSASIEPGQGNAEAGAGPANRQGKKLVMSNEYFSKGYSCPYHASQAA